MAQREQRVTPLELFFDLVLVYAITQVTELMSHDPTWHGVGRGLLVLAALWWAWTGYAWLTNTLEPEEGQVRAGIFGAMAAMLVVALAVPGAFGADAVLFGVAYLLVRLLNIALSLPVLSSRRPREHCKNPNGAGQAVWVPGQGDGPRRRGRSRSPPVIARPPFAKAGTRGIPAFAFGCYGLLVNVAVTDLSAVISTRQRVPLTTVQSPLQRANTHPCPARAVNVTTVASG